MLANPYTLLAIVLFYLGSLGAVGYRAYTAGEEHVIAQQTKTETLIKTAAEAAQQAAAEEISKIEVKNVTIRQKAETITREVPVYRECHHDPDGMQLLNEALAAPGQSADQGKLPRPDPAH